MYKAHIIKVEIEDVADLKKISQRTFIDTYAVYNTEQNMKAHLQEAYNTKQLISEIRDKNCEYYFAKIDEEIAGYIKLNIGKAQTDIKDDSSIEIERIYVLQEYQGNRIGKQFVDFTLQRADELMFDYVWLGVWERNTKALEFYSKMGFEKFDTHHFKLGDDLQTDYLMKISVQTD